MEAQSLSTCPQCGKTFQRKAHLLRHQRQHSGDRPYSCKFCSKTFKRSDVLRDHFSRCDRRGSSAIPNSLERGRKRHACDECSRLKIKCDSNVPCRKCKEFGRECVRSRVIAAPSPETATTASSTPEISGSDRNSIGFLLNFPGETDFIREFPKDTTLSPQSSKAEVLPSLVVLNGSEPKVRELPGPIPISKGFENAPTESNLDAFLGHLESGAFERQRHNWPMAGENKVTWSGRDIPSLDRIVLEQRAFEIRDRLKYTAATMNQPNGPSQELLDAIESITARNIGTWCRLYFRHWHKHGPLVHEATFDPVKAALPLVLALMSIGGMYSTEKDEVQKLKLLLDTIEAYIYSIPGLNDEYDLPGRKYVKHGEDSSFEWQYYQLEELQGAYLMLVLQYWTGNAIARTRVRQQRFSRIVAIFYHLELHTIQHSPDFVINDQQSFRCWILKESYLRMVALATMLDNAFGIFNNASPRFQWADIDFAFPSGDRYFRLANYEELIATRSSPTRRMKVKDAFLILFLPPETSKLGALRDDNPSALDMHMLMHFLYTYIWAHTFGNPLVSLPTTNLHTVILPFKTALWNWKTIWDEIKTSYTDSEWEKLGFQRTAQTYYEALGALLNVFERTGGRIEAMKGDCERGSHLKKLLSIALSEDEVKENWELGFGEFEL